MSLFSKVGRVILNAPSRCGGWGWHGRPAHGLKNTGTMRVPLRPLRLPWSMTLLAALLSAFPALRAENIVNVPTAPEADVSIRLAAPWTLTPRFGFAPVRVTIENRGRSERTWRVHFEAGMRNLFPGVLATDEAIAVAAGQTRDVWVFVPLAEPGANMIPSGGRTSVPMPAAVTVINTPTGTKVTVTRTFGAGSVYVTETDIDGTTGTRTIKSTPVSGASSTRVVNARLTPGSTLTFTIDPVSGDIGQRTDRVGGAAPGRVKIVTGSGPPAGGGATPAAIGSAFVPSTGMVLAAEVSGPGVASGRHVFPGTNGPNGMRPFAISGTLEAGLRGKLSTLMGGAPNLSVVDVAALPADWRVWSSFAGVVLTSDDYDALDASRRSALRGWVALGGHLYLSPAASATASGEQTGDTEKLGAGTIVKFSEPLGTKGAVESVELSEAAVRMETEIAARRAARRPGASGTTVMPMVTAENAAVAKDLELFSGTAGLPDRAALTLERGPLSDFVRDQPMDNAWLVIFLVVFAVVVGPVNLFLFAPAQKRHRLFVTTPGIALVASLILGVTILMQDGVGGQGERRVFVTLLPGENAAAVVQEQAARTGFLARRSFALPDDVAMTVLPLDSSTYYGGPNLEMERGRGLAAGDWFQSRAQQAQQLRRLVPTRARIEAVGVGPSGAPIVQSSLGTTLREFVFVALDGKMWTAAELPSGQRVTLQAAAYRSPLELPPLGGSANLQAVVYAARSPVPGRWWAKGGATELAPIPTLRSIRWKEDEVLYSGTVENATTVLGGKTASVEGGLR
jgi:hypothetical protein